MNSAEQSCQPCAPGTFSLGATQQFEFRPGASTNGSLPNGFDISKLVDLTKLNPAFSAIPKSLKSSYSCAGYPLFSLYLINYTSTLQDWMRIAGLLAPNCVSRLASFHVTRLLTSFESPDFWQMSILT